MSIDIPTSRDRVRSAIEHRQPDLLPVDFGSTAVTGIHCSIVAALRDALGLAAHPVRVIEPYQMLGQVDNDLRAALGIDTTPVLAPSNLFGFKNEGWREWLTPWGQVVEVPRDFVTAPAPDGGVHIFPCGDTSAPASAHLPAKGYFFDTIIRQEPIDEDHLNLEDNLEEFREFGHAEGDHFRKEVACAAASEKAVVATIGGTAFGDIAIVPAPFLKHPKGIRDVEEWYVLISEKPEFVRSIFDKQCELALINLAKVHAAVGNNIDVVFLCGTDFGTQISQFCSVATFQEVYQPYYKALNGWIHKHTTWKTMKHSCGAIRPLIPELIAAGFDILNPVQCSATGMAAAELKNDFGDEITFWGGGVDTQKTLPFGTPEEVRTEVLERCRIFAHGGGFVFDSIHNLQARTPVENVIAMFNAVREFNGLPPVGGP